MAYHRDQWCNYPFLIKRLGFLLEKSFLTMLIAITQRIEYVDY